MFGPVSGAGDQAPLAPLWSRFGFAVRACGWVTFTVLVVTLAFCACVGYTEAADEIPGAPGGGGLLSDDASSGNQNARKAGSAFSGGAAVHGRGPAMG